MKLSGLQRAAQLGKCSLSGPNEAAIISHVTQMQSSEASNSGLGREKQKGNIFPGMGVTDVGSIVEAQQCLGTGSPSHLHPLGSKFLVNLSSLDTDAAGPQPLEITFTQVNRWLTVSENDNVQSLKLQRHVASTVHRRGTLCVLATHTPP